MAFLAVHSKGKKAFSEVCIQHIFTVVPSSASMSCATRYGRRPLLVKED